MIKKYIFATVLTAFVFSSGNALAANEIQYGSVKEVRGTDMHIQYAGPGGAQHFVCSTVGTGCTSHGTTKSELFPQINGNSDYVNSPDGTYGIVKTFTTNAVGLPTFAHTIYNVSGNEPKIVATVPYLSDVLSYRFSRESNKVVLFATDGSVVTYDIDRASMTTIVPGVELALRSISPNAKYLSAYNYVQETHRIWNTETGAMATVPSKSAGYVEFSQDERHAAFFDERDGYQTLYVIDVAEAFAGTAQAKRVFAGNFIVEDYLFFKNDLYAIGNRDGKPYEWVLYRYDVAANTSTIVAENVSHGDYMQQIGNMLSFLTIEGKNTHVALYDPERGDVRVIRAVADSPASDNITRTTVQFENGVHGVMYAPKNPGRNSDLFVWLHGGPKRQTSFGYHSYLSYAVYDELLERLVENGAHVLKLDFAGSYGYGKEFMDRLHNNIGVADVADVINATKKIKREYRINSTYLIGNSYGGYLGPKALVEDSSLFDGAIAINGVFDWRTLVERIPSSPFRNYFDGLPAYGDMNNNLQMYDRASIVNKLFGLDKNKKMLLIYGENDSTVPTWQTREFYFLADLLGKNVELLKIEGEDHIIRKRENLDKMCEFIMSGLKMNTGVCR